jgi:putative molybdopterin biosynthesis protein
MMSERKIFRTLISLEEANERLLEFFNPQPIGEERVSVEKSLGRVLSDDIISGIDVPSFDRAAMDGYAVIAEDTFGAEEDQSIVLQVMGRVEAGEKPNVEVISRKAVEIATGAPMPKGANSVVMVEYTNEKDGSIEVRRAVTPGENVMAAGSDIMAGELVLRKGERITSREMGVIAALGVEAVKIYRKPKVAIISTGNEILKLGEQPQYGKIFDINANSLVGAVIESGCEPFYVGIAKDDSNDMLEKIVKALKSSDLVITSGSTSAGVGDKLYRILNDFGQPGVIIHGLSVKPGKPAVVAVVKGIPVFALPGYPTSAMIIFQILVKPLLLRMTGLNETQAGNRLQAVLALKVFSAGGRREFMPVHVIVGESGKYIAYPVTGGSGAITSYAMADGFIDIPIDRKLLDEGETVTVTLLNPELRPADLTVIGSHCIGIDILLSVIRRTHPEFSAKIVNVGSMGGLNAVARGEADLAGIHLIDEASGEFNISYVKRLGVAEKVNLFRGYNREQGLVIAEGNPKSITGFEDLARKDVTFVNRNLGSGTRILTDLNIRKIAERKSQRFEDVMLSIKGYRVEAKSHSAVATAVIQGKADVGVAIRAVTKDQPLDFIPIADEHYDFLALKSRLQKESVRLFLETLKSREFKEELERRALGINVVQETGQLIV